MTSTAERNFTPSDAGHSSIVGGSTAGRRLACPGSYKLEQQVPESLRRKSSKYADEGTACHEAMAYILVNDITDLDQIVGMTFFDHVMTKQLVAEAIVPAVDVFDELCDKLEDEGGLVFLVEKRCEMPGIPDAFGTSDIIFRTNKRSGILDWKFGAGRPVYAEYTKQLESATTLSPVDAKLEDQTPVRATIKVGNPQLMFYGRAAMFTHPEMFVNDEGKVDPEWPVELIICQPRIDDEIGKKTSRHTTTVRKLEEFRYELVAAVAEATGDSPRIAAGPHCEWAACKAICPKHNGPLLDLTKMHEAKALDIETTKLMPDEQYGQQLAAILDLFEIVEPLAREAMKQASEFIEEGFTVPGWKLVAKRAGHDKWKDDDKVDKYLGRQGLSVEERRVVKPITPAVARKALKAKGKTLDEKYVEEGKSSGSTLAREESARPAIETYRAAAARLGEKLAALTSG